MWGSGEVQELAAASGGMRGLRGLRHNALRVDELLRADVEHLGHDRGHHVLRIVRKGARAATVALAPAPTTALGRVSWIMT